MLDVVGTKQINYEVKNQQYYLIESILVVLIEHVFVFRSPDSPEMMATITQRQLLQQ